MPRVTIFIYFTNRRLAAIAMEINLCLVLHKKYTCEHDCRKLYEQKTHQTCHKSEHIIYIS